MVVAVGHCGFEIKIQDSTLYLGMLKSTLAGTSICVIKFLTFYPQADEGMPFQT